MEAAKELHRLQELAQKRARLEGAYRLAHFSVEQSVERLREAGVPEVEIARAAGRKTRSRFTRTPDPHAPGQPPPTRIDAGDRFTKDDDPVTS